MTATFPTAVSDSSYLASNVTATFGEMVTLDPTFEEMVTLDPTFDEMVTLDPTLLDPVARHDQLDRHMATLIETGLNIKKYSIPPVVAVGLLGNVLTIALMQRPYLKSSTSSVYFSSLAVLDTMHLLHNFFAGWYKTFYEHDLYGYSDFTCKLSSVMSMFCTNAPAWLIVAVAAERVVVTTFPIRGKLWCTRRVALAVSVSVSVLFAVLWMALVFRWGISVGACNPITNRLVLKFFLDHGYMLAISLYTLVPSPLLLMLNAVLVYQVVKANRFRKLAASDTSAVKNTASTTRITVMAVTVSVTYMLLTMPAMVFLYLDVMVNDAMVKQTMREPLWKFLRDISNVLRELNHAVNFFIYLLVLPRVKSELAVMFRACCRNQPSQDSKLQTSSFGKKKYTPTNSSGHSC